MPSVNVKVNFEGKPGYDVRIGGGELARVGARIAGAAPGATSALVITDSNVGPLYAAAVREQLAAAGLSSTRITVPAGEQSKSVAALSEIWQAMAAKKLDRDCVVVALGGGVVGDLAGFAAATYLRGVRYVQLPTSLLAMVDSSVGGKTAVDLPAGKNLVGAFLQPSLVAADTDVLATLPDREWRCGFGEIAKSAVIAGDEFFFWLREHAADLAGRDEAVVQQAIARCVVFKADVVARDETERAGVRECLNYGHTYGHAVELTSGYGTYSHGACVAEGMRFAMRLAVDLAGAPDELAAEQDALLDELGLERLRVDSGADELLDAMRSDKKARGGQVRFVLPTDVGAWHVQPVDEQTLRRHLNA